ncbi:MAG: hypothetical protein GY903_24640 [Fuerstiella sp.]|nr:hypothetical protein [Fuerstiella sp.]MCP4857684.1 hypothetical protein [Fuerstiella sp.]
MSKKNVLDQSAPRGPDGPRSMRICVSFSSCYAGICCIVLLVCCGCGTATRHQLAAVARVDSGTPEDALAEFDKAAAARGADRDVIAIDRALAVLMTRQPTVAEASFRETRKRLDFLRQKDLREQTTAMISDDKAVAWSGREFEQRMVDNLLILSSLLGNQQDAFAYAGQTTEKLAADRQELAVSKTEPDVIVVGHSEEDETLPAPSRFSANALSAYLNAAIRSENPMDADLTQRAIRQVGYWSSSEGDDVDSQPTPIVTASFGTNSQQGNGVVHIITFTGRITDWLPERAAPTSAALLIADQILSAVGDHTLPPTVAPVQIAKPATRVSTHPLTTVVRRGQDRQSSIRSRVLVDLNKAAWDSYDADRNNQIARAVSRRIVKKGAVYAAKNQMSVAGGSGTDLLLNLGGIAWEALEKPDTRHVHLLPERIEVVQVELPAGDHTLEVSSVAEGGQSIEPPPGTEWQQVPVRVDDGRNTFVLCFCSRRSIVNTVVSNETP